MQYGYVCAFATGVFAGRQIATGMRTPVTSIEVSMCSNGVDLPVLGEELMDELIAMEGAVASTARLLGEATKHMACTSVAVSTSDISDCVCVRRRTAAARAALTIPSSCQARRFQLRVGAENV